MADNNEDVFPPVKATIVADQVDGLLDIVGGWLKRQRFEDLVTAVTTLGHWALLAVAVLGFVVQLIAAIVGDATHILWGIGWLVALPLLQYTAVQFLDATRTLVNANGTSLGSRAFLRCYALVALIVALVALIAGVAWAIEAGTVSVFLSGLVIAALSLGTVWLALNPGLLAIRIDRQSNAGQEALGILSFFIKAGVRLVPIFYGIALLAGALYLIIVLLGMIGASQAEALAAVMRAELAAPVMIWAVLSPFLAYVAFVAYFLVIDLLRGILGLSGLRPGAAGATGGAARKKTASSRKKSASKKKSAGSTGGTTSTGGGAST